MSTEQTPLKRAFQAHYVKLGIGLFALLLVAVAVVQSTLRVAYEREQAVENAHHRNSNLAIAFESYAIRILKNAETVAKFVVDQAKRVPRDRLAAIVKDRAANNELLGAISVFDARGDLVATSAEPATQSVNVSAAEYFATHAGGTDRRTFVGKPSASPVTGKLVVPVTHPLHSGPHQFAGIVLVEIEPVRLTEFYKDASIGEGDVISIVGFDGITRARRNGSRYGAGEDVSSSPMMALRRAQPAGIYVGRGAVDGRLRHYSYRTLPDFSMLVIVGATEDEILAEHVQRRLRYFGNAAIFSVVCLLAAGLLIRELVRRQRLISALASREENFRFVLESSRLGYWERDLSTGKSVRSLLHDQIFGYQTLQPEWTFADFVRHVHPDDRERLNQAHDRLMRDAADSSAEYRIIWPDGSVHWLWSTARLDRDATGRPARISGVVLDISTRKAAEEQLAQSNVILEERILHRTRELEEANRELEAFAHSVSHDLSAPLQVIEGLSASLLERFHAKLEPEAQRLLEGIRRNAQKFSSLIEALLASARASTQAMHVQKIDTNALVREALAEVIADRPPADYALRIHDLPESAGDRALLKQLWINLLSNAFKFSAKRDEPAIEVGSAAADGKPAFYVRDNGAGFNMNRAERLFQVFQRFHPAAEFPGAGVGLAIAHRIVARHGGRIWASSAENQGATFYFTLGGA